LARAYTGRTLIASCGYHGWHDWSIGLSENDRGVPEATKVLTLPFKYNDIEGLTALFKAHPEQIAAVILEPIELELPQDDYLQKLRALTAQHGALLIFDEVLSGFRFDLRGAGGYFKVVPDLVCFGKAIANGADLSVVAGRRDVMKLIDEGVFVSMTFAGNAIPIVSAFKTLEILEKPESYPYLWQLENRLIKGIDQLIIRHGLKEFAYTRSFPAHTALLFRSNQETLPAIDLQSLFQQEALKRGVIYLGLHNLCLGHTQADIDQILQAYEHAFQVVKKAIQEGNAAKHLEGQKIRPIFVRNG